MSYHGLIYAECSCCGFLICVSNKVGIHDFCGNSHLKCPACAVIGCSKTHISKELSKNEFAEKCGITEPTTELQKCPCCGSTPYINENASSASIFCSCGITVTEHYILPGKERLDKITNIWNKRK